MKTSMIIGILIIVAFLLYGILSCSSFSMFIDVPAIILVCGILIGGILLSFGSAIPYNALKKALQKGGVKDLAELKQYVNVYNMASQLSIAAGIIGSLIGMINMLARLEDPSTIGPSIAVALLTVFYGVLLSELVFQPLKHALITKSAELCDNASDSDMGSGKNSRWIVLGLGVFVCLVPFALPMIAFKI